MEQRENQKLFLEFGRLLGINELMEYTSLGRNTAMELGKNASAIVRIGKRVLYDRHKIDKWIDSQAQDR
jgi:predicted DNA-binding transcriptional regulator AlpA